jgi:predicted metal-dependent peptidase
VPKNLNQNFPGGPRAVTSDPVTRKLHSARARLVMERPFLGALVLHLDLVASRRTRSLATDARAVYFNPDFVARLDFAETQFLLAHEALHCALGHFARGRHRIRKRWDLACDYAVNQLLADDGMRAPAGAPLDARFRGLAAEEIYPLVPDDAPALRLDDHWFGTGAMAREDAATGGGTDTRLAEDAFLEAHRDGFDELGTRAPTAALADAWKDRLAAAASEAAQAGRLPGQWHELLGRFAQPRLPWRALLERFLVALAREDYSFAKPSRREGPAVLPGLAGREANLVVALDTSGSIDRRLLAEFADEVDALKGRIRARVALLFCDAALSRESPLRFEPWEAIELPSGLVGGGGTRFTPVFDWAEREPTRPDALVYFTDAQGEFPAREPDYPVLWIVTGNASVPWGTRVQLN